MTLAEQAYIIYTNATFETLEADFAAMNKLLDGHQDDADACAYAEGLSMLWTIGRPGVPIPGSPAAQGKNE